VSRFGDCPILLSLFFWTGLQDVNFRLDSAFVCAVRCIRPEGTDEVVKNMRENRKLETAPLCPGTSHEVQVKLSVFYGRRN
jgi:hypothetical protein